MYLDIANFLINGEAYPVSLDDCFDTLSLLHSFYKSDEIGEWINIRDAFQSERLGMPNEKISNLYRTLI